MRKLIFYTIVFPGFLLATTALFFALLAACQLGYLPSLMGFVLWFVAAACLCFGVSRLARRWRV